MTIAIHGRNFAETAKPYIQVLFDTLAQQQVQVQVSAAFYEFLKSINVDSHTDFTYADPSELVDADWMLTIGGDGTLLDAVTHVGARQTPIVGVNTGRLGFLATVGPTDIPLMLKALFNREYELDERTLVSLQTDRDLFDGMNFALNDVAIAKTDISSMITIHAYLDGEFLNSYWADGLVISTPSGSTGYSLSCGGPVVLPQNNNLIITPISPHNLNVRPMIIPDTSELMLKVESRSNNFLVSLDSRYRRVEGSVALYVRKEQFKARLVKMKQDTFIGTLRTKLHWGLDARN